MTTGSPLTRRMPALFAPAPAVAPAGPRHLAPETSGDETSVPAGTATDGRHREPEWARELLDARRDGDPLDWLGFTERD